MKVFLVGFSFLLLLSSCSPAGNSTAKGTGLYPNSIYTSTTSKDLLPAVYGAANSKVKIKIFSDFECPACIVFHNEIETKLWNEYVVPNKISLTYLNYPLTFSTSTGKPLHPNAEGDALAALCALPTGKYKEYRDALYKLEEVKKGATVTDEERVAKAKELGIDGVEFSQCLTGAWYQKTLNDEIAQGNRMNLEGTPSVYLNDVFVNYKDDTELFGIIEAALKQ